MLLIDTNILLHAFNEDLPSQEAVYGWLTSIQQEEDAAISEFILAELYGLLPNPDMAKAPTGRRGSRRSHSDLPQPSTLAAHWLPDGKPTAARCPLAKSPPERVRLSSPLRPPLPMTVQGVTEFATVNVKDYEGFGFRKVWNPLTT